MNTITANGIDLSYVDSGAGRPLLLVHGFPVDHSIWASQIPALARQCRVIAPDLRGFGQSGASNGIVTMEMLADDLAAMLEELGITEPVVLCGWSMGGYVAFQFWKRHRARLRGLILCDTRAGADTPETAAARRQTAERVVHEGAAMLVESMLPRLLAPATLGNHPHLAQSLRRVISAGNVRGIAAASRGMAQRADFVSMLPDIDCPTLLIVGSEDVISTPAEMAAMAGAIPGARLVEIAGAGHASPLEQPEEVVATILQFVANLP
jgi:pimeloyl-ACP methyl ester carboxylesterase